MPTENHPMASPCRSRGYMSSRNCCDNGTSAAPKMPWTKRETTAWVSDTEAPALAEQQTKPTMAMSVSRLRPIRRPTQPDSGVKMATAIRKALSTQEISSCVAEKARSEEHTSELQSLMRISYAVFCLKKKKNDTNRTIKHTYQQTTYNN